MQRVSDYVEEQTGLNCTLNSKQGARVWGDTKAVKEDALQGLMKLVFDLGRGN